MARNEPRPQRALDAKVVAAVLRRAARANSAPWLHAEVARRLARRLEPIRLQPRRIVDWWSFTGGGGALLANLYPAAQRCIVDPTPALLERSRAAARRPWWKRLRLREDPIDAQLDSAQLQRGAQMIWSNMMLHFEPDPPALFARWHGLLEDDGLVIFSCLGPGTLRELRALYARLGWGPPAPEFVDMHDLGDMLVHAGFQGPVLDQETLTLHWPDAPGLLAELRSLGGNAAPQRFAALRTPHWRERLLRELETLAGADGRLRLSFEVAYGHAFKGAVRAREPEPTRITLEDMRALVRSRNTAPRE